jgi:predicted amidohydrolase YtcJ
MPFATNASFDLILYNGSIYTMDGARPREESGPDASALAISSDRIVAAGELQDLRPLLSPQGRMLDLGGSTVLPGLIDSHLHFCQYSLRLEQVDLQQAPTLEEALRRVAERAARSEPGAWIRGGGWNCNLWGDGAFPHHSDLDQVAPHNPVVLSSKDGHSTWVNRRAMELAQITATTPDPPGGHIRRDPSGEPTGILQENAAGPVRDVVPQPSLDETIAACQRGLVNAHRAGLTGIHDCEGPQALAAFQELHRRGELTMRVLTHIPAANLDAAIAVGLRDGLGDEWMRLHGVKAFSDGALGSRSAWMLSPYEDDPANLGIPTMAPGALHELIRKANGAGLSVAVHAIGDAANRAVLDAIDAVRASAHARRPRRVGSEWGRLRNRIEHVQLLHPDDLPRLAQLGVVASMQPIHATSDIDIADLHWGVRAATGYAWRSLLDAGTRLAFGSDAPVEDISPLLGIHAAVTRRRPDGSPGPEGWYPEQRLTVSEAVYAYTMGAAYAGGEEALKGSLIPGKLADLVLLDRDIFQIEPMDILHTHVLATMVGGKFVYQDRRFQVEG